MCSDFDHHFSENNRPTDASFARLAVDTGCEQTMLSHDVLKTAGYDLDEIQDRRPMITGSEVVSALELKVKQIQALSRRRQNLRVFCRDLPRELELDGTLGLDFFRNRCLTINFKTGKIDLEQSYDPQVMTIEEMRERFDSEWVLIDEPETDEQLQVLSGRVILHSADRKEFNQKMLEW